MSPQRDPSSWRRQMPPGPGWLIVPMLPMVVGSLLALLFTLLAYLRDCAAG